jgi:3-isopropylmalate/(R)-2-methylmalate dehydratase large subunit
VTSSRTLVEKIWDDHVVASIDDETDLLYIDLHLIHEVSTPQAFTGLDIAGRRVRRPDLTLGVMDHVVPTDARDLVSAAPDIRTQLERFGSNCATHDIRLFDIASPFQGIVHVVAPEQGMVLPGMTVVCGDSHTSTLGAFGCLAFGIGTSEVEHVLATQTLPQRRPRTTAVELVGPLPPGTSPKDLVLHLVRQVGIAGGIGQAFEFRGDAVRSLSMEGRMTICNMTIEAGARIGLVAPDETTIEYLADRNHSPTGPRLDDARAAWAELQTDPGARFDRTVTVQCSDIAPTVTWGTTPAMNAPITGTVPRPEQCVETDATRRALDYMGLVGGERITDISIDRVFIGSCTNSRIEDLRAAADVVRGRHVAPAVRALVVPGSVLVKEQAEREGLADVFRAAGFEWREPGCSMCIGMNGDSLGRGERCASTSNRNFEGRQGPGGRTHLASPAMAAAAAIHGHFVDVRDLP